MLNTLVQNWPGLVALSVSGIAFIAFGILWGGRK